MTQRIQDRFDPVFETEDDLNDYLGQFSEKNDPKEHIPSMEIEPEPICTCDCCVVIFDAKGRQHRCCQEISTAWLNKLDPEDENPQCLTNTGKFVKSI